MKLMKKITLFALAALTFSACEDVPAPYTLPGEGTGGSTLPEGIYINEKFSTDFGVFTPIETEGEFPWIIDYSTAKATSCDGSKDNAAQSWLVSDPVDFTNETEAYVAFEYIIRYSESGKVAANHEFLISDNYSGDPATATWTNVPYNAVEGSDWNTFYNASVAIPAEFMGKSTVVFALKYTAKSKAGTWEVKNFIVAHGTPETPQEPEEAGTYTVSEAQIETIEVDTDVKLTYYTSDESFEIGNGKIKVNYEDGTTETIDITVPVRLSLPVESALLPILFARKRFRFMGAKINSRLQHCSYFPDICQAFHKRFV